MYIRGKETDWKNKVILVTGAASGLGQTIAECLATAGAQVVVCARREKILTMYQDEYKNITPVQCDIKNYDDVVAMFKVIREKFNHIDVVVNNAGRGGKKEYARTRTHKYPVDEWKDILEVNVLGTFHVSREALALMMENKTKGLVINIASGAAYDATSGAGSYSPSKSAVSMFTELLSKEYGASGIRAIDILPGYFPNTDIFAGRPKEQLAMYASSSALGRAGENWEIAELVKYVASDDARYMLGSHIAMDGGTIVGANAEVGGVWRNED